MSEPVADPAYETILYDVTDRVATITLNRPEVHNALSFQLRTEIVDAFRALAHAAASNGGLDHLKVDEQSIAEHLYTRGLPDPDLVIRTSGEMRLSNFLLWQLAYAEIFVTQTLWPDFGGVQLLESIEEYQKRERRYGGLGHDPGHPHQHRKPLAVAEAK